MNPSHFGVYLVQQGVVTQEQLQAALELQQRKSPRIGDLAVDHGLLTTEDARRIRRFQLENDALFGAAARALGLLTDAQLDDLLRVKHSDEVRLGEALVELELLDEATLAAELVRFREAGDRPRGEGRAVPVDVPDPLFVEALISQAHALLLRSWGVHGKPGDVYLAGDSIRLPGIAVRLGLPETTLADFWLGVPTEILDEAQRYAAALHDPIAEVPSRAVADLARQAVTTALQRLERSAEDVGEAVQVVSQDAPLDGMSAVVHHVTTPRAEVVVAVSYSTA